MRTLLVLVGGQWGDTTGPLVQKNRENLQGVFTFLQLLQQYT